MWALVDQQLLLGDTTPDHLKPGPFSFLAPLPHLVPFITIRLCQIDPYSSKYLSTPLCLWICWLLYLQCFLLFSATFVPFRTPPSEKYPGCAITVTGPGLDAVGLQPDTVPPMYVRSGLSFSHGSLMSWYYNIHNHRDILPWNHWKSATRTPS